MPPSSPKIARFANEVVLGEETDLSLDGKPLSHFELYLQAVVGAETADCQSFHRESRMEREVGKPR